MLKVLHILLINSIACSAVQHWLQSAITIFLLGFPVSVPHESIFLTTSIPSQTDQNTTCLPSSLYLTKIDVTNT